MTAPQKSAPARRQHSAARVAERGNTASEASTTCTAQPEPKSANARSMPRRTSSQCSSSFRRRNSSSLKRSDGPCSAVPPALSSTSAPGPAGAPSALSRSTISRPSTCTRKSRDSTSPSRSCLPGAPGAVCTSGRTACCQESQPLDGAEEIRHMPALSSSSSHQNANACAAPFLIARSPTGGSIQEPRFARRCSSSRKSIVTSRAGSVKGV
mmetsp:Transcript_38661/g.115497  ORF Transcript_38661/g.115497 Transcript_38661/m.115497 type:complete len:211 (-) Transcript_38661:327-959(-)